MNSILTFLLGAFVLYVVGGALLNYGLETYRHRRYGGDAATPGSMCEGEPCARCGRPFKVGERSGNVFEVGWIHVPDCRIAGPVRFTL